MGKFRIEAKEIQVWSVRLGIAQAVCLYIQGACFCRMMMEGRPWTAVCVAVGALAIIISAANLTRRREQMLNMQHGLILSMQRVMQDDPEFRDVFLAKLNKLAETRES